MAYLPVSSVNQDRTFIVFWQLLSPAPHSDSVTFDQGCRRGLDYFFKGEATYYYYYCYLLIPTTTTTYYYLLLPTTS